MSNKDLMRDSNNWKESNYQQNKNWNKYNWINNKLGLQEIELEVIV
jgi:hypothetical protein